MQCSEDLHHKWKNVKLLMKILVRTQGQTQITSVFEDLTDNQYEPDEAATYGQSEAEAEAERLSLNEEIAIAKHSNQYEAVLQFKKLDTLSLTSKSSESSKKEFLHE
uniref:Uncharacterized protein n=1 Tax=Glossina austeni TaxID=7395 RepID=A0A1A9UTJ7_GLOAU